VRSEEETTREIQSTTSISTGPERFAIGALHPEAISKTTTQARPPLSSHLRLYTHAPLARTPHSHSRRNKRTGRYLVFYLD